MLNLGTVYRALFTTLKIQPNRTIFIEGAATGTGFDALKSAARNGLRGHRHGRARRERAQFIRDAGAVGVINRKDPRYKGIYTRIPEDPGDLGRLGSGRRGAAPGFPRAERPPPSGLRRFPRRRALRSRAASSCSANPTTATFRPIPSTAPHRATTSPSSASPVRPTRARCCGGPTSALARQC